MSINNLNNVHLTDQQVNAVNKAITDLETALRVLTISLTPEERSKYGRVNEQNKLLVNKIYDFAQHQSALRSPDVDWAEFLRITKAEAYTKTG